MEQKQSQLDGKMIEVFLSTTRNVVALTNIKIMFMDFMGKFEEGVTIASPYEPKSILEQQAPIYVDRFLVKLMHNVKQGTCLHLHDVVRPTMTHYGVRCTRWGVKVDRQGLRGECKVAKDG
jgi:hypothetical protein